MKLRDIIMGIMFVLLLLILYNIQKNSLYANTENFSNIQAVQNIAKVYADTSGTATFNNLKITGNLDVGRNLDVSGIFNAFNFKGVILAWSGAINSIPLGWALCDGSNNTPDLRGRFILGHNNSNNSYNGDIDSSGNSIIRSLTDASGARVGRNFAGIIGNIGGEIMHKLTVNEMPSHTHNFRAERCDGTACQLDGGGFQWGGGSYAGSRTTISSGGNSSHNNLPPFYVLAFIIKL
jgi:microcystin-dependent protein